ncbi:MAG TPA: serine hydrolase domain-containing protein [Xanthobacteraceae bacterium]|nr:serine hydrolase domain-containing protein [Xanthobacteraceae bacterium]
MLDNRSRRDILKTTAKFAAGSLAASRAAIARAKQPTALDVRTLPEIDAMLRLATGAGELPGIVALAATDDGIVYEGVFGVRRLHDGPAMTRDTVFRIGSMIKLITSVAALQLVEQGKLSLDAPVPDIEPALGSPQVLDGFDAGTPQLRPAKRPISLRQLLTHTAGFTYRLWDAKAVQYFAAVEQLPKAERSKATRAPLMFDPGERWQYGTSIDWVGRIVELISGERLDRYFRQHILDPLGMSDTAFVISPQQRGREASVHRREPNGSLTPQPTEPQTAGQSFSGGGGIYSTGPDYLTLIRMLMRGGAIDGVRILHPETVALMGQNQIGQVEAGVLRTTAPALSRDVDFFPGISLKWGFGHMINMQAVPHGRSAGSLTWGGLLNTYYWIDPSKRIAAVFMTQVLPFADDRALHFYRQFERGIYAAVKAD